MASFREKGGEFFRQGDFTNALAMYTQATQEEPTNAIHWSNRAFCNIKLEFYGAAVEDAEKAIALDPKFAKGYYRKACAKAALNHLQEAIAALKTAKGLVKSDAVIDKLLVTLQKKRREQCFFECISYDEEEASLVSWRDIDASSATFHLADDAPITGAEAAAVFAQLQKDVAFGKCSVHLKYVLRIIEEAKEILRKRTVLHDITITTQKMTVVGDIHGQFYDLIHLFELNGLPSEDNVYLFNGDYVDRGSFGVECVVTLFAFMIAFPNSVFLARGNHETRVMNSLYGFQAEVLKKLGDKAMNAFTDVFLWLPYCHVINRSVFVVHGGIPPTFVKLDEIRKIPRGGDPVEGSTASALLWADPQTNNGSSGSIRGTGRTFGPDITMNFLFGNGLKYLIRSHEMKPEGYEWGAEGKLLTVFSAPNYCDQMKNFGAYVHVTFSQEADDVIPRLEVLQFRESPHPDIQAMAYATDFSTAF